MGEVAVGDGRQEGEASRQGKVTMTKSSAKRVVCCTLQHTTRYTGHAFFSRYKMLKTEGSVCRLLSRSELDALRLDMREASKWMRAELRRRRAIEEQGAGDANRPKPLVGVVHLDKCR